MQEINHQLRNPNPFMANYTAFDSRCDLDFNCQIPFLIYVNKRGNLTIEIQMGFALVTS